MTIESDFMEPEYEAAADEIFDASLPRRAVQILFYGGSAAALGLMLLVYASPAFASRVGASLPQGLVEFAAGDSDGCSMSGGCPPQTRSAAKVLSDSGEAAGCCSSLSRSSLLTSAGEDEAPRGAEGR